MIISINILRHAHLHGLQSRLLMLASHSKIQSLLQKIEQAQRHQTISFPEMHPVLIQLLDSDLKSTTPYSHYSKVKKMFKLYLVELTKLPGFEQYDPKKIQDQGRRLSQIAHKLAQYPKFELEHKHIINIYRIFCRFLNHRTDEEMSNVLMLALKVDEKVEQSVLYQQYLKYYLGQKWETLKAKYQLDLGKQSIGNMIKKITAAVVHRGFLRRTPDFTRSLQIAHPTKIMKLVLENPSTLSSLLIRKLMYEHIFSPIVHLYQQELHSNLYHPRNTSLWSMLNQSSGSIFQSNELVSKEATYLRELYIKLFLVLRQQRQFDILCRWFGVVGVAYGHAFNYCPTETAAQFRKGVEEFVQDMERDQLIGFVDLDEKIFELIKNFPSLRGDLMRIVSRKITALTFCTYFTQISQLMESWDRELLGKMSAETGQQENMFDLIPPTLCLSLVRQLTQSQSTVYYNIIGSIVHKQYDEEPSVTEIIAMLEIYVKHTCFLDPDSDPNLPTLRVFLFRFIADAKDRMSRAELTQVMQLLINLGDEDSFDDENGNYDKNIFEELEGTIQKMQLGAMWKKRGTSGNEGKMGRNEQQKQ